MRHPKPLALLLILLPSLAARAQDAPPGDIRFRAVAELGFLGVLDHKVQFGNAGTYFDYREDGGQDVLFPVSRLSVELEVGEGNTFVLLYQPLRLETDVLLQEDLIVDGLVYPAGSGVRLLYNSPFYRVSYLDASLRAGVRLADPVRAFLIVRYLGGGAVGTSVNPEPPSDGYVKNWLHFATVSVGFAYAFGCS